MKIKILSSVLVVALASMACASVTKVSSTETAATLPANTQSSAPENTTQESPSTAYELGERLDYEEAGFSFQPIKTYDVIPLEMNNGIQAVILHDEVKNFSIYFYGTKVDNRFKSASDVLIFWMPALTQNDPEGVINPVSDYPVTIDGVSGIAVNVTGQLLSKPLTGQVISLWVSDNQYLFVLGFSDVENHSNLWEQEGQKAFDILINTVEFAK